MDDGCADLRLEVIAENRQAALFEGIGPSRIAGEKHRYGIDIGRTRFQRATRVELTCLLRADGQETDHHLRTCLLQYGDYFGGRHLGRRTRNETALWRLIAEKGCHAIEARAAAHRDVHLRQIRVEDGGAVRGGEDGFREVATNLSTVDINGSYELDVAWNIWAEFRKRYADRGRSLCTAIVNSLNK